VNLKPPTPNRQVPLRWGVLGATAYISGLLMPAIAHAAGCSLAAVASRPERYVQASAVAAQYEAIAHKNYASLVADPDIDAVYIALPNTDHVEWALQALAAGKHVLVEKPMAMNEDDVLRIECAAARAGRTVMEAFMYRFHPQQQRAADLLAAGVVGELRVVRASFAFAIPTGSGNIRLDSSLGGGATWDVGCYAIDVPQLFFGQAPNQVRAQFSSRPGFNIETSAVGWMDFGGGRSAVLDYSIDYGPRASYELQGTRGTITVRNAWAMGGENGVISVLTPEGVSEELIPAVDHYQRQVRDFAQAVRHGRPSPLPLTESRRTARVGAALMASARADSTAVVTADQDRPSAVHS
jgi:xylose dehydrogenase (NAD/NADP)